ncbi:MAG TPA: hypothetical protein VGG57_04770 [Stellaceae bacterium]|jgi:hypothetical protein
MGISGHSLALALVGCIVAAIARADDARVVLRDAKPVAHGIAAFPKIVAPKSEAATRVNRALEGADASVDRVAVDCNHYKGWHRTVSVTMGGPRYLSLLASDDWYCGGAYPDTEFTALVFDLSTGAPIDWMKLFPADFIGKAGPSPGGGVSDPIGIESPRLWDLFVKTANAAEHDDCNDVRSDPSGSGTRLMIWPNAKDGGIDLFAAEFPHVVKACAGPATLPTAELRKLGADAALLDAIDEAHAKGWYDDRKQ